MKKLHAASLVATAGLALAGAFYAGVAYAAVDPKLDQAVDFLTKADALLEAAENPGVKPPFGGHRESAQKNIKQAIKDIEKAKKYAEKKQPKPAAPPQLGWPTRAREPPSAAAFTGNNTGSRCPDRGGFAPAWGAGRWAPPRACSSCTSRRRCCWSETTGNRRPAARTGRRKKTAPSTNLPTRPRCPPCQKYR